MGRAPCCDKENVKRGPWSPEEDAKLKDYIENSGIGGNWITLPQKIGLRRCGKSCRLRWLNYLRPNIKHGGFSEEEDNIICNLYLTIGTRWSIIASQLPGRTDNDIKNYWNTKLKKKLVNKQKKEFQEARIKQDQRQSNNNEDFYNLNNILRSSSSSSSLSTSPWPILPQLPPHHHHHQVPLVMMEPRTYNYNQTTQCNLEQKPLNTLKNMVKIEEEPKSTNLDHHNNLDSIINTNYDVSLSHLLLDDPNYYLGSSLGGGDHHQEEEDKKILQWFESNNFQIEPINNMFLNNNIVNLQTTKLYENSLVAEDITSLVNFNGPNCL